jgi:drug/metabolite transporter (DMT)-like permease
VVSGAMQQVATGLAFLGPALITRTQPIQWSGRSVGAVIYLITFGSVIGYSAYLYALDQLPVSIVTIYNYINPIVALFLGWLIYREPVGMHELGAMLIIFLGVTLVKRSAGLGSKPAVEKAVTG